MSRLFQQFLGPRVPLDELLRHRWRFAMPSAILGAARVLLLVSIFLPYWHMELEAPQYPSGLFLTAYVNHLTGDVREINSLNHYIGMRPLDQAASFERTISVMGIISMVLLVEGAALVHSRWAVLLALPAVFFPLAFLVDLQYWLHTFGQNLDPAAPLSNSVRPFTPTILGEGGIGQFATYSWVGIGFWLAVGCSLLTVVGFYFHRRAYKPLFERVFGARCNGDRSCCA